MTDQLRSFGTVTKLDLVSDPFWGIIEIDYGSSEIMQLLMLAIEQLPDKNKSVMKAKSTIMGCLIGNLNVEVVGRAVLNKKVLKETSSYHV